MAEALVFQIICELGSVAAKHAEKALSSKLGKDLPFLIEVESQVKQIASELTVMHPFLSQAQKQAGYDATLQVWLQQVQKLAFEIEDIIDEYTYLVTGYQSGFGGFLKNTFRRSSKDIYSWRQIATELKEIQNHLQNLWSMKLRYNITMSREPDASCLGEGQHDGTLSSHPVNYNELVGIHEEREKILQCLTTGKKSTSIMSVWGMGGSGKTTLVRNVYESKIVTEHFDYRIRLSVSQKYQIEDILKRMVKNVFGQSSVESSCNSDLMELLQRNLQNKRYLIVLDDVWNSNVWIELSSGLGDNNYGARVIITTRLKYVAILAVESHALGLRNLHESEAWDLFCRWAFRNIEDRRCPEELEQWARKILGKCHGLPLAIVVAGNLLSFKRMDVAEWIKFYNEINLDNQNLSPVARVLKLSYNHLSSHLKSCFLFCSIFPEDYLIHRKRLIRLWVAEGLVEEKRGKTLEQVAEEYLNELVGHCLLQILERNDFGRIRSCQMHDLVREFAISTSAKENFCMIYDKSEVRIVDHNVRRMSLDGYTDTIQSTINFSHLRSFYLFDANNSPSSLISCTARYLRVLDLQNVSIETPPDDLFNLFNLRYLGLRNTRVRELPMSLGKLRRPQTLDLCNIKIEKLPSRITQLQQLRHLFADKELDTNFRNFHDCSGVQAPKGLWDLRNLQTLQDIEASTELVRQLGKLTQLRSLRIRNVKRIHCRELFTSIGKMHFLSNLSVFASDENEYLILEALNRLPSHLLTFFERQTASGDVNDPFVSCHWCQPEKAMAWMEWAKRRSTSSTLLHV